MVEEAEMTTTESGSSKRHYFPYDKAMVMKELGKDRLLKGLEQMVLIRNFETRAEAGYLQGHIGGFFHSYIGQEAIQTAAVDAIGKDSWWATTYRCHALALLLGATPNEIMAELYGRANGNALGRGGSMHLYTDRLLGGFGIVGGQIPIATGAAFTLKYEGVKDRVAVCFMGDGAIAQGAFHESLNQASLWDLPCIFVIENNQWGMGTAVDRAISVRRLAEDKAAGYGMDGYSFDGMDYLACYAGFKHVFEQVTTKQRPVLVECVTERFKGHSVSDPGLYRSKDALKACMEQGPIILLREKLQELGFIDEDAFTAMDKAAREVSVASMKHAEESPWPDPATLESDVFAP
ncbi:Pyruvate dehydrogenase E1 component subunit alpha [Chlamydiales bacterium SCGC AG-110-P3]|nr:Pyruvate dehydrogenase E1 component subunit alpha [Chlamydiales bacterium SCGC AG-110-P3]